MLSSWPTSFSIPLPFSIDDSTSRFSRDTTQILTKFLKNRIYNFTVLLSFETYPEEIYTIPRIRENFSYIDTHSLVETPDEPSSASPLPLLLTLLKRFVKTSTQSKFTFLSLMFLPLFSKTSLKRIIFYINMLSLPLLYKHSFKRKPFLTFLILNNSALLKLTPIIVSLPIFFKSTSSNINFPKSHYKHSNKRTNSSLFTLREKLFRHVYQLIWYHNFQYPCVNFPSKFTKDDLSFLATSDNRHPFFFNLRDFTVSHSNYLSYDTHRIDKSFELSPHLRPYATRTHQIPPFDTTSDVSLQNIHSTSNVLVNTYNFGILHQILILFFRLLYIIL